MYSPRPPLDFKVNLNLKSSEYLRNTLQRESTDATTGNQVVRLSELWRWRCTRDVEHIECNESCDLRGGGGGQDVVHGKKVDDFVAPLPFFPHHPENKRRPRAISRHGRFARIGESSVEHQAKGFSSGKLGRGECVSVARRMILSILTFKLFAGSNVQLFSDGLVEQAMNSERLSQDAFHVDPMLSILKVLTETALGLQEIFDKCLKPLVSQLAKAVASLPEEPLALIFKFATLQEGTRQAIRL